MNKTQIALPSFRRPRRCHALKPHRGFTMLGVLFLLAGLGVAMAALGTTWHTVAKREKEKELLHIGDQYRKALASYHDQTPGNEKRYPQRLEELLEDNRFPTMERHLRRIYRDPITGLTEWGLVKDAQGGITGVYSLSEDAPMKTGNFPAAYSHFIDARSYREWVFQADSPAR